MKDRSQDRFSYEKNYLVKGDIHNFSLENPNEVIVPRIMDHVKDALLQQGKVVRKEGESEQMFENRLWSETYKYVTRNRLTVKYRI